MTHGYRLIDITGLPTRWGHWEPDLINRNRTWSDERGLNAMQMLGLLAASLVATPDADDPDRALFTAAWAALAPAATEDYLGNLRNLKIQVRGGGGRVGWDDVLMSLMPPAPHANT